MSGIDTTAQTVGNIAQSLNSQAYNAYANFAYSLPSVTAMSNSAYGFTSSAFGNVNSTVNSVATNVLQSVNAATSANQQMVAQSMQTAPEQYQAIAQNAGGKK